MSNPQEDQAQQKITKMVKAAMLLAITILLITNFVHWGEFSPPGAVVSISIRLLAALAGLYLYRRWQNPQILPIAMLFLVMAVYQTNNFGYPHHMAAHVYPVQTESASNETPAVHPQPIPSHVHPHLQGPVMPFFSLVIDIMVLFSCYYLWRVLLSQEKEKRRLMAEKSELSRETQVLRLKLLKLEEILPICQYCKKIRLGEGDPLQQESWSNIEEYFKNDKQPVLSHGICPECAQKYHPGLFKNPDGTKPDNTENPSSTEDSSEA